MPTNLSTENNLEHLAQALELLHLNDSKPLSEFLDSLHPVELVSVLNNAEHDVQLALLQNITGLDHLSAVVALANETLRDTALGLIDDSRIAAILRRQDLDDAADIVSNLPRRRQLKVLKRLNHEKVVEIRKLLSYDQDTAGRLMTPSFLTINPEIKAQDAISNLLENLRIGDLGEDTAIQYGYVLDEDGSLLGVCSLRELLSADPSKRVLDVAQREIIVVSPDDDQEKVARLIADYDLTALPVCTEDVGKMLGIITVDDVLDVIEEEYTEDLLRLVGTEDQDRIGATMLVALRSRIPWLAASWMGGVLGAMLLGSFATTLERVVALAFFMPVVFGMGGNVGSQSSTITVRGLATGELTDIRIFRRIRKECLIGMFLGITFGCLLFLASYWLYLDPKLSGVIAISICATMSLAATLGAMIPVIFKRLGIDPAVASGPLVTTGTDILSIFIYFSIANLFI